MTCKECKKEFIAVNNAQKFCSVACRTKNYNRVYHKKPHGKKSYWNGKLKSKYGITIDLYEKMLASQGGACAVCGLEETTKDSRGGVRRLAVDHDHTTGKVRSLLCTKCNLVLGLVKDNKELLLELALYLER